jgi:hypothetical protein
MAKTCQDCKRAYPDEYSDCPYCVVKKTMHAGDLSKMAELLGMGPKAPSPAPEETHAPADPKSTQRSVAAQPEAPVEKVDLHPPSGQLPVMDVKAMRELLGTDSGFILQKVGDGGPEGTPVVSPAGVPRAPQPDAGESSSVDLGAGKRRTSALDEVFAAEEVVEPGSGVQQDSAIELVGAAPPTGESASKSDHDFVAEVIDSSIELEVPTFELEETASEVHRREEKIDSLFITETEDDLSSAVNLGGQPATQPMTPEELKEAARSEREPQEILPEHIVQEPVVPHEPIGSESSLDLDVGQVPVDMSASSASEIDLDVVSHVPSGSDSNVNLGAAEPTVLAGTGASGSLEPGQSAPVTGEDATEWTDLAELDPAAAEAAQQEQHPESGDWIDYPPPLPQDEVTVGEEQLATEQIEPIPEGEQEPKLAGVGADTAVETAPEPTPRPASRPRAGKGGWIGGTVLGALVGTGVCLALWFAGIEPPIEWRAALGGKTRPVQSQGTVVKPPMTLPEATVSLRNGDLDKAKLALEQMQEENPDILARRGEARWLSHLQQNRDKAKTDDKAVQEAVDDLKKSDTAEAWFSLGQLYEQLKDRPAAQKAFTDGLEKFKGDPVWKRRFEAMLHKLDETEKPAGAARAPQADAAMLALVLIALQDDKAKEGDEPDEAGFKFWEAVKYAKGQDYAKAVEALKEARTAHDKRRYAQLRKAQNPLSDPTEEIFLRSCDELLAYWQIQERLKKGGYLDAMARKDPLKAIDELVKKAGSGGEAILVLGDKLVKEKLIEKPEELDKGIDKLLADRKTAADTIAKVKKEADDSVAEAKKTADDLKKSLDDAKKTADDLAKKVKSAEDKVKVAEAEAKTQSDAAAASKAAMKKVLDELVGAKLADPKADDAAVLQSVKNLVKTASNAPAAEMLKKVQAAEEQARTAQDKTKMAEDKLKTTEDKLKVAEDKFKTADAQAKTAQDKQRMAEAEAKAQADAATASKAAMKKVRDELITAKVVDAKADDTVLLQGVKDLIKTASKAPAADLLKRVQTAEEDAKVAQDKLKTAETKLKETVEAAEMSKAALKKVQDELVAAKIVDAKSEDTAVVKGVRELIKAASTGVKVTPVEAADPLTADKHYATGLNRYFARRYADAEKDFEQAVENNGQDARFYYFLGLSRLMQNKRREALADFEQGALLEQQDRPGQVAVSKALERIQGTVRQIINEVRERAR